jgi:hypothetical protein
MISSPRRLDSLFLQGGRYSEFSALPMLNPERKDEIHPYAKQVMREISCRISNQHPEGTDEYLGRLAVTHLIIASPVQWPPNQGGL